MVAQVAVAISIDLGLEWAVRQRQHDAQAFELDKKSLAYVSCYDRLQPVNSAENHDPTRQNERKTTASYCQNFAIDEAQRAANQHVNCI